MRQQGGERSSRWLDELRSDLRYGTRALVRTPGFTAVAAITLGLGIGAVTVIYSLLRNVVLDPFPYSRSDRMVNVVLKDASDRVVRGPYSPASEFLDYQESATVFEDVVGTSLEPVHWISDGGAERLIVAWMTPNGFDFLGVPPLLGRVFAPGEASPGRLAADARDCDQDGPRRRPRARRRHGDRDGSASHRRRPRHRRRSELPHQPPAGEPAVEHVPP